MIDLQTSDSSRTTYGSWDRVNAAPRVPNFGLPSYDSIAKDPEPPKYEEIFGLTQQSNVEQNNINALSTVIASPNETRNDTAVMNMVTDGKNEQSGRMTGILSTSTTSTTVSNITSTKNDNRLTIADGSFSGQGISANIAHTTIVAVESNDKSDTNETSLINNRMALDNTLQNNNRLGHVLQVSQLQENSTTGDIRTECVNEAFIHDMNTSVGGNGL